MTLEIVNALLLIGIRIALLCFHGAVTGVVIVMLLDLWREFKEGRR